MNAVGTTEVEVGGLVTGPVAIGKWARHFPLSNTRRTIIGGRSSMGDYALSGPGVTRQTGWVRGNTRAPQVRVLPGRVSSSTS